MCLHVSLYLSVVENIFPWTVLPQSGPNYSRAKKSILPCFLVVHFKLVFLTYSRPTRHTPMPLIHSQSTMAASKDINICIFKPLKCDTSSTDGYLSAHLEGPNVHGSGKSSDRLDVPLGSLILTAWALLLKYYLATDLVSFASSGIEHVISDARDDKDKCGSISQGNGTFEDLIHSLEIEDDELVSNIIRRIRGPATQRSSTPELLSCVNTMILYGSPKMNVMHRGMVGNSVVSIKIRRRSKHTQNSL